MPTTTTTTTTAVVLDVITCKLAADDLIHGVVVDGVPIATKAEYVGDNIHFKSIQFKGTAKVVGVRQSDTDTTPNCGQSGFLMSAKTSNYNTASLSLNEMAPKIKLKRDRV